MNNIDKMIAVLKRREEEIDAMISEIDAICKRGMQADIYLLCLQEKIERELIILVILSGLSIGFVYSHLNWNY